jgi:hypothetical protein
MNEGRVWRKLDERVVHSGFSDGDPAAIRDTA